MAIDLSTAGVKILYGIEATADTKPASFTNIVGVKSIPEINPEPSQLQTTSLNETEYHTYIDGLKDVGGSIALTFNMTEEFSTTWESIVEASESARAEGKKVWFEVLVPGLTKAFFLVGKPSPLAWGGADVDSVLETTVYVTPEKIKGWDTKVA